MKLLLLALGLLALAFTLASCGAPSKPALTAPPASTTPPAPQALAGASELFATNCAACHGAKREGVIYLGPSLTPQKLAAKPDAQLKETIKNGRPGTAMLAWSSKLTEAQIDSLVQFIKTVPPR
jgi:mono/diheme cytochrome c family protein